MSLHPSHPLGRLLLRWGGCGSALCSSDRTEGGRFGRTAEVCCGRPAGGTLSDRTKKASASGATLSHKRKNPAVPSMVFPTSSAAARHPPQLKANEKGSTPSAALSHKRKDPRRPVEGFSQAGAATRRPPPPTNEKGQRLQRRPFPQAKKRISTSGARRERRAPQTKRAPTFVEALLLKPKPETQRF
jgi:hypothetical protein